VETPQDPSEESAQKTETISVSRPVETQATKKTVASSARKKPTIKK
jgi:hypothetical protein